LLALCLLLAPALHAQQPAAPGRSVVFAAADSEAIAQFEERPAITRRMVDQLVLATTRQPDVARAWRSLVAPADRVGIKISAAGGRYFSTHRGIVEAVIEGLAQADIPRERIVIWDRDLNDLRNAGFTPRVAGCAVQAIDPPRGFDREATFSAASLGRLIWGDLLFRKKRRASTDSDELSSTSHLARILTRGVTKIINLPMLAEDPACGVRGALYNVTVPNVDNWRRFTQPGGRGAAGIAALYADERVGPKVVLHLMDGLLAQYAGGPRFDPNYAFAHATLYASKDPVALDATALRLLEPWRKEAKLPPIGPRAEWLQAAAELGLGHFHEEEIDLVAVAR